MRSSFIVLLITSACCGQAYQLQMPTINDICLIALPAPGTAGSSQEFCGGTLEVTHYYQLAPFEMLRHSGFDVSFDFNGVFEFEDVGQPTVLEITRTTAEALPPHAGFANARWNLTSLGRDQYVIEDDADIIAGFADITFEGNWRNGTHQSTFDFENVGVIGSFNDSGVVLDASNYPASLTLTDNRDFLHDFEATLNDFLDADYYLSRMHADAENLGKTLTLTQMNTLLADANGDNLVDGADFVIWNAHKYTSVGGGTSMGDFDQNGFVDGVDFLLWHSERAASGMIPKVPEPGAATLLLMAVALNPTLRRRRRRESSIQAKSDHDLAGVERLDCRLGIHLGSR